MLTHVIRQTACRISCFVRFVRLHDVFVNIDPAGTVFKCQTFNLLNLILGGIQACQSMTAICRETRQTY